MDLLDKIGKELGIQFVDSTKIAEDLCLTLGKTYPQLIMWLQTREAYDYIAATYGKSQKLPGFDV